MFLFKTCCYSSIRFKLNVYVYFRTFKDCTNLIIVHCRHKITWSPSNVPTDWLLTVAGNNLLPAASMLNLSGTNLLLYLRSYTCHCYSYGTLANRSRLFSKSWALPQGLQNPRSHEIRSLWRGDWNHLSQVAGCKKDWRWCKRAKFVWILRMDY